MSAPHTAMVLAAGYGTRMKPLTDTVPKPLLAVGGRTMLDQALDRLREAEVRRVVVNASYLAEQIEAQLAQRHDLDIALSYETKPLETGGGIKQALYLLGDEPIFVINADLPWRDAAIPALQRLRGNWDASRMDCLLLTMPRDRANGFDKGDFLLHADGRLQRHGAPELTHVYIGAQIVKPALYRAIAATVFSNNLIFDRCEAQGRLYGCEHDGTCYHVGTPADLRRANELLSDGGGWATALA